MSVQFVLGATGGPVFCVCDFLCSVISVTLFVYVLILICIDLSYRDLSVIPIGNLYVHLLCHVKELSNVKSA